MPTSTWFGGAVGVPRPVRMKPRTMRMRVKPVSVNSAAGMSVSAADQQQELDGVRAVGLHLSTVRRRSVVERPGGARLPRSRARRRARDRRATVLVGVEQPERAGLVLGVGADRRDAVLGDADQHDLAAGAHEVQRAVGAERQRGERLQAVARGALLAARLDLLRTQVRP